MGVTGTELYLVWLAALMGSAHCVGMCGGFALAVAGPGGGPLAPKVGRGLTYHVGKTGAYVLMGVVVGALGALLLGLPWVGAVQNALSIAAGVFMIAVGLSVAGLFGRFDAMHLPWLGPLKLGLSRALRARGIGASLAVGFFNGFLPCGLVYAFLAQAATTGTPLGGALVMFMAGLGTVPALLLFGTTGSILSVALRTRINRLSGVVVVLLGLITVLRATPLMHRLMGHDGMDHQQMEMSAPAGEMPAGHGGHHH